LVRASAFHPVRGMSMGSDTVPMLADQRELSVGALFEARRQTAWVPPARDQSGRDLVLKVGWGCAPPHDSG